MSELRLGIDLGGTKVEVCALDAQGEERLRRRVPTPREDYAGTVQAIAELVRSAEAELGEGQLRVGVGMPGAISPATGLVKNANSTWLNGQPFDRDLCQALGREVRLANDADCLTLSEASDGAAQGARVVFGVILGTGVGGGIVVDGLAISGPNAIAGEWGHNPLPAPNPEELPGPQCYCGRRGCIETFLSGPALMRDYRERAGRELSGAEIAAQRQHDPEAAAALGRYVDRLARALGTVINLLDPDAIVLGGGVSNVELLYDEVPARWSRYVFSDTVRTRLVKNVHGDSSGVRGAARLWPLS